MQTARAQGHDVEVSGGQPAASEPTGHAGSRLSPVREPAATAARPGVSPAASNQIDDETSSTAQSRRGDDGLQHFAGRRDPKP